MYQVVCRLLLRVVRLFPVPHLGHLPCDVHETDEDGERCHGKKYSKNLENVRRVDGASPPFGETYPDPGDIWVSRELSPFKPAYTRKPPPGIVTLRRVAI